MNFVWSIVASIIAAFIFWYVSPLIAPLQGNLHVGLTLVFGFVVLVVAILAFRRGAAKAGEKEPASERKRAGTRVATGIKSRDGNVTVRVDGVETDGSGDLDVASDIDSAKGANVHAKNVKNKKDDS